MTPESERILLSSISSICGQLKKAASAGRPVYRRDGITEGSPKAVALRDLGFTLSFGSKVIPPDPNIPWEEYEEGEGEDVIEDYVDISGWADPSYAPSGPLHTWGPLHECSVAFRKYLRKPGNTP